MQMIKQWLERRRGRKILLRVWERLNAATIDALKEPTNYYRDRDKAASIVLRLWSTR